MIKITVSEGRSANALSWKQKTYRWDSFLDKLYAAHVTHEKQSEFVAMTKIEQGKIKDVGGYVCGIIAGGRRKKENIISRTALTLDIDYADENFIDTINMFYGHVAYVLHSTHSHHKKNPRYRLIIPLDREVTPDESVAIHRKVAEDMGITNFDPTTFDVNRLMFWPSISKDAEYVFEASPDDYPALRADEALSRYRDWKDISQWAFHPQLNKDRLHKATKKQQDPLSKNNIVGNFCSIYSIHDAIETFLPDVYEYDRDDRYTYVNGSTSAGLITYDDLFAFSHHGTDPISGQLCNAFDLVRIHLFGERDTEVNKGASYNAMCDFVREIPAIKCKLAKSIIRDFEEYTQKKDNNSPSDIPVVTTTRDAEYDWVEPAKKQIATAQGSDDDDDSDWLSKLDFDKDNKLRNTAGNFSAVIRQDPKLKGRMYLNAFDGNRYISGPMPWVNHTDSYPRLFDDIDHSGFRNYIERVYGIENRGKVEDALNLESAKIKVHPVRDYLSALKWDGVPRIDTLLIDCFNAADTLYTREVSRKTLIGAIARVVNPGCKFDTVTTLVGPEGTRKSTFWRVLGGDWFSDTPPDLRSKDAYQMIQGQWISELAELSALSNVDTERIKQYIASQVDIYRPTHGKELVHRKRQGIFVATTNNYGFLRGSNGNRRFWPIDVNLPANGHGKIDPISREFAQLRDQIWAEAYEMYFMGESLILSYEAQTAAKSQQDNHKDVDDRQGVVVAYLNMPVPENWSKMNMRMRRDYVANPDEYDLAETKTYVREHITALEVWCECFGKSKDEADRRRLHEVHSMLRSLPNWEYASTLRTFPPYGKQRHYSRVVGTNS